jgi:hypothetical protein
LEFLRDLIAFSISFSAMTKSNSLNINSFSLSTSLFIKLHPLDLFHQWSYLKFENGSSNQIRLIFSYKFKSKKNKQVNRHKEWFTPSLILLKREFGWHKFSVTKEPL